MGLSSVGVIVLAAALFASVPVDSEYRGVREGVLEQLIDVLPTRMYGRLFLFHLILTWSNDVHVHVNSACVALGLDSDTLSGADSALGMSSIPALGSYGAARVVLSEQCALISATHRLL